MPDKTKVFRVRIRLKLKERNLNIGWNTKRVECDRLSRRHPGSLYLECHLIAYNFAGNTVDSVGAFRRKCSTERKICRGHYSH